MPRFDKYTIQNLGFGLISIGIILFIISFLANGLDYCPLSGCDSSVFRRNILWYALLWTVAFFSSIALIAAGIILLIVARRTKPAQEAEVATVQAPASK